MVQDRVGLHPTWLAEKGRHLQPWDSIPPKQIGHARTACRLYAAIVISAILKKVGCVAALHALNQAEFAQFELVRCTACAG